MANKGRARGQNPEKKARPKPPPRNFVIAWREENGPTLGYAVAELVVYFPRIVVTDDQPGVPEDYAIAGNRQGAPEENVANPAFDALFAPGVGKPLILKAVAVPDGVVSDGSFRVDMASMSGAPFNQD